MEIANIIAANHQGFGYASPALVGVPFALIGSIALFILHKKYPVSTAL